MKKTFALLLSAMVLVCGTVSASAAVSPKPKPADANNNKNNSSNTSSSPKTGATGTYALLMAGAALAFGGVAAEAKKKMSK